MSPTNRSPARSGAYYRADLARYPKLSLEAEAALFSGYRRRRTAKKRDEIVRQYLYWAAELACRYCGPRMPKAEAISAANFGLMQAIADFDPARGRAFVTHSYFAIRREVLHALRDSYVVNPESALHALRYRFKHSEQTEPGRQAYQTGRREIFDRAGDTAPLPGDFGGLDTDGNLIETDRRGDVERASLLELLRQHLPALPKNLQAVVELRYFNGGQPLSFVELGTKLRCSPDHARWLHNCALKQLRKLLRSVKKEL